MNVINTLPYATWAPELDAETAAACTEDLESGMVALLPKLNFELEDTELYLLSPEWSDGKAKNISYDPDSGALKHTSAEGADAEAIARMMGRFYESTYSLVTALFPKYARGIRPGMTSYRPVEAQGRASSLKKDDSLLHVDAFVSRPTGGDRILRVFSNINPEGRAREWILGKEPFEELAKQFMPRLSRPLPGSAWLMDAVGLTKGLRTAYDHYMLQLHDKGKEDGDYQKNCPKLQVGLPAHATWIVFADAVSHAVLAGQYLLEQTYYLPVESMQSPSRSPLRILERLSGRRLA